MSDGIILVQAATGLWLFSVALVAVVRLARGNGHAALLLTCVHFLLFGMPLLLDVFVGTPDVTYPGLVDALQSNRVTIVYCAFVAVSPILWQWVGGTGRWGVRPSRSDSSRLTKCELVLFSSPLALALVLVGPSTYLRYGTVAAEMLDEDLLSAHSFVSLASMISIAVVANAVARMKSFGQREIAILTASAVAAVWLNGKRAIIVVAAVWIGYTVWRRRGAVTISLLVSALTAITVLVGALVMYQWQVRGITLGESGSYSNVRIDYGRDLVLKQTLHAELEPNQGTILDYRGQGFLFYATLPVPRTVWPDKPWPYAVYQTSRMLNIQTSSIGWGITTSWLDECVANLGLVGLLVGPVTLGLFCRVGHSAKDTVVDATTAIVAILFLTLQFAAFYPLVIVWTLQRFFLGRRAARSVCATRMRHRAAASAIIHGVPSLTR